MMMKNAAWFAGGAIVGIGMVIGDLLGGWLVAGCLGR